MIDRLISSALEQRLLVMVGVVFMAALGFYAYINIPIDAFPDITNTQVQILSTAPGRSPVEVERFVTYPIEAQMTGLPGLVELRSISKFGLSVITVVFEDGVDIYFARQLILERLAAAKEKLPQGVEALLAPVSTGLGEIYQYTLEKPGEPRLTEDELRDLRTLQDWALRPILRTIPGVADINSFGGFVKQYEVIVQPQKLIKYGVSLGDVFDAVSENNSNAGGGVIESSSEQYIVRGVGLIEDARDIEDIVVKEYQGTPVFIKDVADVALGHETRQGALVKDGRGEAVGGIVMMVSGGNGREIVSAVKAKIEEINNSGTLKEIKIKPFYDRTELVEKSVATVTNALKEGAVLIVIILYLFLRSIRGAVVVVLTLPLAVLATLIVMWRAGLSANLMSLGGLAISLGMIIDAAIIQVENAQRHLSKSGTKPKTSAVLQAVLEVRKPSLFGELIIAVTFLPIITLEGIEGKLFSPLAYTVVIALLSSLVLSIFVVPVLCSIFLKSEREKESPLVRWANKPYLPALKWAIRRPKAVISAAVILLAGSIALFPFLGTEFIPTLEEGTLSPQIIRLPSISLTESIEMEKTVQQRLRRIPEVETVVSRIGTAEIATDPMGPNLSDPIVTIKPKDEWKEAETMDDIRNKIREELESVPGINVNLTQPIALRFDELISGVRSQIGIKIFGDDMDILKKKADEIAMVMSTVEGVRDLRVEQIVGQPYLTVNIDRRKIARYGINVSDVQEIIETAIGGKVATEVFEGDRSFGVLVRFPEENRNSVETISGMFVKAANGASIPLASLANISVSEGPVQVSRENSKRRIVVEANVEGRDIGGFVAEGQSKIQAQVDLPLGYYITWGGQFENQQRAMKRLFIVAPLTIALIFFLLFTTFNSLKYAALIIFNLCFAAIGGIFGLWISGQYLSVPASVGFIALFGVSVLNGVVLVSYINNLREEGMALEEAIVIGSERRLKPILMTAFVAILGLIPLLFADGPGSEVQKPLATVVVGGLISSTILTLIVLPTLYGWVEARYRATA
ncbi:MAG: efflux RND transporter permease subunit [Deltaproteobacteria bacterium]